MITEPAGARVTVDGVGRGATPITISDVPFGDKRIRVTKQGYASEERIVRVDGTRPARTLRIDLQQAR
ncbi:MAG: PEGA domain-containing protein [Vicinamibacterales bacterium]